MNTRKVEIFKHVRDHGGWCVGRKAIGAWETAKQATLAESLGFVVKWDTEMGDWMDFAGDPVEEYRRKFADGSWEVFNARVEDESGNCLASLGGIILGHDRASDDYRECVGYELLAEAMHEILKGVTA